jgi:CRP-like cAMP-binding protein
LAALFVVWFINWSGLMLYLGFSDPVEVFLTFLVVLSIACYFGFALYVYLQGLREKHLEKKKRKTLVKEAEMHGVQQRRVFFEGGSDRSTASDVQVVPVSSSFDRRNSTLVTAELVHAKHLEGERRLHKNYAHRREKQRRRTQDRVKARARLRASRVLHNVSLFRELDDTMIGHLVTEMEYESPPLGTTIVREGDIADSLYVLVKGNCGVYVQMGCPPDESGGCAKRGTKVALLSEFDLFGESALLYATQGAGASPRRNASVVAESDTVQLLKLMHGVFETLVESGRFGEKGERILWKARAVRLKRLKQNSSLTFGQDKKLTFESNSGDVLSSGVEEVLGGQGNHSEQSVREGENTENSGGSIQAGEDDRTNVVGEMKLTANLSAQGMPTAGVKDDDPPEMKPPSPMDELSLQLKAELKSTSPPPPPPPRPQPGSLNVDQMKSTTAPSDGFAEHEPDLTPPPAQTALIATIARARLHAMLADDNSAANSVPPKRQYTPRIRYDLTAPGDDDQGGRWL